MGRVLLSIVRTPFGAPAVKRRGRGGGSLKGKAVVWFKSFSKFFRKALDEDHETFLDGTLSPNRGDDL